MTLSSFDDPSNFLFHTSKILIVFFRFFFSLRLGIFYDPDLGLTDLQVSDLFGFFLLKLVLGKKKKISTWPRFGHFRWHEWKSIWHLLWLRVRIPQGCCLYVIFLSSLRLLDHTALSYQGHQKMISIRFVFVAQISAMKLNKSFFIDFNSTHLHFFAFD